MQLTYAQAGALTFGQIAQQVLGHARGDRRRRGGRHITKKPVLRDSKESGTAEEEAFWIDLSAEDRKRMTRTIYELCDKGRELRRLARAGERILSEAERQITAITRGTRDIFLKLLNMAELFKGRLYPSYEEIAERSGFSRATVGRALVALRAVGLVERRRRYNYEKVEGVGARSEQTSNAYRLALPPALVKWLPRWMQPAPLPDDRIIGERERLAQEAAMLSGISNREYIRATFDDPGLSAALQSLAIALGEGPNP